MGCGDAGRRGGSDEVSEREPGLYEVDPLTRPILRPWADDIVWMASPTEELPVAYVSMATREVFVDRDFRDRASWLLEAHISVSTGVWRIPLPDDPEGEPISPGDEAREFEEIDIRAWSPLRPQIDDVRIVRGRRASRVVDFSCVVGAGAELRADAPGPEEAWYTAGRFTVEVSDRSPEDTTREDFRVVGTGLRHQERGCSGRGSVVQLLSWACPPA